jgi:hypothetical protein
LNRHLTKALIAIALLSAGTAGAVKKGESLYVKSKDTKVLKDPKATSKAVVTLQPGAEVTWNGASEKDKQFHEIATGGKKGYVLLANLTPNKPTEEISGSTGKPLSPQAFASSAAATKALSPAGLSMAKKNGPSGEEAADEIIYVEDFNNSKGTPEAITAKAKELAGAK